MLKLRIKGGESVRIGDDIIVKLARPKLGAVYLEIVAPKGLRVDRLLAAKMKSGHGVGAPPLRPCTPW